MEAKPGESKIGGCPLVVGNCTNCDRNGAATDPYEWTYLPDSLGHWNQGVGLVSEQPGWDLGPSTGSSDSPMTSADGNTIVFATTAPELGASSGSTTTTTSLTTSGTLIPVINAHQDPDTGPSHSCVTFDLPISQQFNQLGESANPCEDKETSSLHHIATDKNDVSTARGGPWTPRFKSQFFDRAGMDISTDPGNLVQVANHVGPHPEVYHQLVFNRLRNATSGKSGTGPSSDFANALRAELQKIGTEAATPGTLVNKLITKPDPLCP